MPLKACQVTLGDGRIIVVKEPQTMHLTLLIRAMPGLMALSKMFGEMQESDAVIKPIPDIPPTVMNGIDELISSISDITVDDYRSLPLTDGMALLSALNQVVPTNFTRQTSSS